MNRNQQKNIFFGFIFVQHSWNKICRINLWCVYFSMLFNFIDSRWGWIILSSAEKKKLKLQDKTMIIYFFTASTRSVQVVGPWTFLVPHTAELRLNILAPVWFVRTQSTNKSARSWTGILLKIAEPRSRSTRWACK